jgi:hypothetical protein
MVASRNLARLFEPLLPIVILVLVIAVLLRGSAGERIVGLEIAVVFGVVWFLNHSSPFDNIGGRRPQISHRLLVASEFLFLSLSISALLFVEDYTRPLLFFVFVAGFYSTMFMETLNDKKSSTASFLLRLVVGQFIFLESFAILYPGFVAVDSYRDLFISQSIVSSGGGLPQTFTNIVWYDFSPMAPLLYAIGHIVSAAPLRTTELGVGFAFPTVSILAIGSIVNKVTSNMYSARIAILFGSLLSYLWVWATWPIPEMFALSLVCLSIVLCLQSGTGKAIIGSTLLVATVVLTHGGMAIILTVITFSIFLLTRIRTAAYVSGVALVLFLVYSVYAFSQGVQLGIVTFWTFLLATLTESGLAAAAPTFGQSGSVIGTTESALGAYWWILLAAFAWLGFLAMLKNDSKYKRISILLTILAAFSFGVGISSAILATRTDTIRYFGLIGYPLLCISASVGLVSLGRKLQSNGRIALSVLLFLFVISGVVAPSVSPDFWQDVGQGHYAAVNRLSSSTTIAEEASQISLNNHDNNYYITSNYFLEHVDIGQPLDKFPLSASFTYIEVGYTQSAIVGIPHVVLISLRAIQMGFPNQTPPVVDLQKNDIVYSSSNSIAAFALR